MDLTFVNNSADFYADNHFNLHLEGAGRVALYRRTSGKSWDYFATIIGDVIDDDVVVNIPKDFRVVCASAPTRAVLTFADGTTGEGDIVGGGEEVDLITFTVEGYDKTFKAERGMNWVEFCASEYNTEGWDCGEADSWIWLYEEGDGWFPTTYYLYDPLSPDMLLGKDLVKADHLYSLYADGGIGGGI